MTGTSVVGVAGWGFLVFAGVLLPLAATAFALSERRRAIEIERAGESAAEHAPSRIQLYGQVILTHVVLLAVALGVARVEMVSLFPSVTLGIMDVVAAVIALIVVVSIGELSWQLRSMADREQLWVRRILPRTAAERRVWILVSACAAVAEEVGYRGVFVAIAATATGSVAGAIVASAVTFALVHAPQGPSSVGYVFVIALIQQALVIATGTLLLAIIVHFAYDVLAGLWLARRHKLVTPAACVLRARIGRWLPSG